MYDFLFMMLVLFALLVAGQRIAFALGTVPGLLLLGTGASHLARRYRVHSDILAGLLMIYMAGDLGLKALSSIFS